MNKLKKIILLFCTAALAFVSANAAIYNSVRVDRFDWKVYSTENFDIYYYEKSFNRIKQIAEILEEAYLDLGALYDCYPKERSPFFIYSTHNEFEQTNIVDIGEGTGGVTEAFKNRFAVFNDGSVSWLEQVIRHEYTHVIQFTVLYGGFWKSARLLKSFFYPLWLLEGTAEYSTGDIDKTQREMYLRDASTSGGLLRILHLMNFNHLKPHQITLAYKQSESVIRFIEYEYGREKIPEMFNLMKSRFDASSFLRDLLKQDIFTFEKRYMEFMREKYALISAGMKEPTYYGGQLTKKGSLPVFNTNPVFSPCGKYIYYISDKEGHNAIYALSIESGRIRRVFGRYFRRLDKVYTDSRALDITPDGENLIFAAEYKQKSYICIYNLKSKRLKKLSFELDEVKSPKVSNDGNNLVFIGMKNSINDVYLSAFDGTNIINLTDGPNNDDYPIFGPDDSYIIYTSEDYYPESANKYQQNIYKYDIASMQKSVLTMLEGDDLSPALSPNGRYLYFINDQDSVLNIYRMNMESMYIQKLTDIIGGNFTPNLSADGEKMVFASFWKGETHLYMSDTSFYEEKPLVEVFREDEPEDVLSEDISMPFKFKEKSARYSFKASTDLIFPIFFYSSLDGFFASIYYQASEYLGNHKFQAMLNYGSRDDIVDYDFAYIYSRFRPNFIIGGSGENYYRDIELKERAVQHAQYAGVEYPVSRISSVYVQGTTIYREERYRDFNNFTINSRENVASLSYRMNTTTGRYLYPDSGYRGRLTYEYSDYGNLSSDYEYQNYIAEFVRFFPVATRTVFASRMLFGTSDGPDKGVFRLGGFDRVKGYPRRSQAFRYNSVAIANFRLELPIVRDMNYYMWYFFPDLFFKELHFAVFTDTGFGWNDSSELKNAGSGDIKNSVGMGLHFYTFILQSFQMNLNFDWVKRTDSKNSIFYFTLGPVF